VKEWSFDWTGLWLFVLFIAPVLLALSEAHRLTATSAIWIIALLIVGLISLVLLLRHEQHALFPLIPVNLLRRPAIWRSDALAACHGAMLVSLVTFLPLYFRVVRGLSAGETGLLLLPLVVSIGVGSMITGRLVSRTGYTTIFPSVGLVVVLSLLLFFSLNIGQFTTRTLGFVLAALGLFMGTVMGVVQITVQRTSGPMALGQGAASVQFSRSVGAALGTAIVGMVLFAAIALMDSETGTMFAKIVDDGPSVLAALPPDRRALITAEIATAFKAAFTAIVIFACLAIPLCWTIPLRRV
jgi:predicted MFS family arabinose efflux permease